MPLRIYLTSRVLVEENGTVILDERRVMGRQGRLVFAYRSGQPGRSNEFLVIRRAGSIRSRAPSRVGGGGVERGFRGRRLYHLCKDLGTERFSAHQEPNYPSFAPVFGAR